MDKNPLECAEMSINFLKGFNGWLGIRDKKEEIRIYIN
jgi:hypothetical protein